MTESVITYGILAIIGILAILSFVIGIDKMIRIILGNYILNSICLAASQSIVIGVNMLQKTPEAKIFGWSYEKMANFLDNGSMTIVVILYAILLVIVYKTSKIRIVLPEDEAIKKMLQILFVPLTVLSMILTLQIVILGMDGVNITAITDIANTVANNPYMFKFISLTPLWILIHGIITILITSEFKIRVQTDL